MSSHTQLFHYYTVRIIKYRHINTRQIILTTVYLGRVLSHIFTVSSIFCFSFPIHFFSFLFKFLIIAPSALSLLIYIDLPVLLFTVHLSQFTRLSLLLSLLPRFSINLSLSVRFYLLLSLPGCKHCSNLPSKFNASLLFIYIS